MTTSSTTKKTDPRLVCPDWCDLDEHDQCEVLDELTHSRDLLHLTDLATDSPEDAEDPTTRVGVDVTKYGFKARPVVRLTVGEQLGGSASLSVQQATDVIQALTGAIDIVERVTS